ncbi:MAG TPA: branched-chain amino acid ABC transporter permease, partial [Candidatus Bathyarchaeia archaeon]|nr:branched-chain amino acid ABC transporter permease [Candidatus Bathyarchaeia archaeon]
PTTHPFLFNLLIETFLYAYLSLAWNILAGLTGQNSFGHAAFFGIGAYSAALLWTRFAISPWIAIMVAVMIAALASLGVGLPSLKLKKSYFVMITLGFSEILRIIMIQWYQFANGAGGIGYEVLNYSWWAFQFNTNRTPYYYIMLSMLLLSLLFVYKLKSSKWGYYFMAIKEDEIATATSGINVVKYKLVSCVISAMLTAVAGVFFAQFILFIDPDSVMSLNVMTYIFMPAAIGGIGTIMGPVIGAFILIPLGEYVRIYVSTTYGIQGLHLIIFGALILIVGTVMPKGILGTFFKHVGRTEETNQSTKASTPPTQIGVLKHEQKL